MKIKFVSQPYKASRELEIWVEMRESLRELVTWRRELERASNFESLKPWRWESLILLLGLLFESWWSLIWYLDESLICFFCIRILNIELKRWELFVWKSEIEMGSGGIYRRWRRISLQKEIANPPYPCPREMAILTFRG